MVIVVRRRQRRMPGRGRVVRGCAINGWTACPWLCERGLGWHPPATGAGQCEATNLSAARVRQGARSLSPGLSTARDAPARRGAERPGDIGFLAGRREPFGCCPGDLSRPVVHVLRRAWSAASRIRGPPAGVRHRFSACPAADAWPHIVSLRELACRSGCVPLNWPANLHD